MRRGLFVVVVMALMLLVPSVMLFAQAEKAPGAKDMKEMKHMEHMKMQLTDEQKAKIKEIRLNQRLKVIDAKASMEKDAIKLRDEIMENQANMTQIEALLRKIADARVAMQTARIEGLLEVRKILGPDWKSLMREARMGDDLMGMGEMEEEGESEEAESAEMDTMGAGMGHEMGMMGEGRKMIVIRKGMGPGMGMGRMGECPMMDRPGAGRTREGGMMMRGGCCCMGMGGCCCMGMGGGMMQKGEGMKMGQMGGCMMQKGGEGAGMGKGCGMMQKCGGMNKARMGGACMAKEGARGSCCGACGGWTHKGLYRPRTGGMRGHSCTGSCKHEMKEKTETKQ